MAYIEPAIDLLTRHHHSLTNWALTRRHFLAMLKTRKLSVTIDDNPADYQKWLLTKRGAASVASENRREAKLAEKQLSIRRQNTSAPRSKIRSCEKQLDALSAQKRDIQAKMSTPRFDDQSNAGDIVAQSATLASVDAQFDEV